MQNYLLVAMNILTQTALSDASQLSAAFIYKTWFIIVDLNIPMRAHFLNHTVILIISLIFQQINRLCSYIMNSNISQIIIKY